MKMTRPLLTLLAIVSVHTMVMAQTSERVTAALPKWNLKTNLLSDLTTTLNLGTELLLNERTSIQLPLSFNPWTFSEDRKWKHFLVQPEYRRWTKRAYAGSFFGVHAHYALYNAGKLPHGPFSRFMNEHRFEGWLAGVGVSYGYRWNLDPRWAFEATLGVGYAYMDYDKYLCGRCGDPLGGETKHYFGPTKAGLSLILALGRQGTIPSPRTTRKTIANTMNQRFLE